MNYLLSIKSKFLRLSGIEKIIITLISIVVFFLVFFALDSSLGKLVTERGKVESKRYTAPYVTFQTSNVNNVTTTIPVQHPATYKVNISTGEGIIGCSTYETQYHKSSKGDRVQITYSVGWITDGRYCKSFNTNKT